MAKKQDGFAKSEQTADQKTLQLIAEVKKRKEEIGKAERANWITNCSFVYVEGRMNDAVNLHAEMSVKNLITYAAFLQDKEQKYKEMAKTLGVESVPAFTWNGFKVSEWLEDIKTRINKIQLVQKKQKLEELEKRLEKIVSPELRAAMELEAISAELE